MIYLRSSEILFLKPRKVAGSSFEIALSKFATAEDVITPIDPIDDEIRRKLGFGSPRNYKFDRGERSWLKSLSGRKIDRFKFFKHISAADARDRLGSEAFESAFKISVVRNPFDTLVSHYFWANRSKRQPPAFRDWLRAEPKRININDQQYLIDRAPVIDFFIRFESFGDDLLELENRKPQLSGIAETFASMKAKSSTRPKTRTPKAMFAGDTALIAEVRSRNSFLIDHFGYELC